MSNNCNDFVAPNDAARAVQIVSPVVDHSFQLELGQLEKILLENDIKDRYVVVVSIAGAYRKGKSFLMNFLLKYLHARYKKFEESAWMGENDNIKTIGFKSRGGSEPETSGIWMWSEIFTYDHENGEKIAIILLDTQGMFDQSSSVKECTTIFALSMLVSSVQCFNLMQNIQDDDLQFLSLFANYAEMAKGELNEKPFQKLLFVVRDWPYEHETGYGWNGSQKIDKILAITDGQSSEKQLLRQRITSSFEDISGFLFPYPGNIIAKGNSFTGDLREIDSEFIKYMKEFVPAILAPENLCVKKINNQKVRARDLVDYFQKYTNIFSGNNLPEPKTILMTTADASNLILHNLCLNDYNISMQKALDEIEPCLTERDLLDLHEKIMAEVMTQFSEKPKLGGNGLALSFGRKLENDVKNRFVIFQRENEMKRKNFIEKLNLHNEKVRQDNKTLAAKLIFKRIANDLNLTMSTARSHFEKIKSIALEQFERDKMGCNEYPDDFREKLNRDLITMELALLGIWESHDKCLRKYTSLMKGSLEAVPSYLNETELMNLHQKLMDETLAQFMNHLKTTEDDELASAFKLRIKDEFDAKFKYFWEINNRKRRDYYEVAAAHNNQLCERVLADFIAKMQKGIGKLCLKERHFAAMFLEEKLDALEYYDSHKMKDAEIGSKLRQGLEQKMDELRDGFRQFNKSNRSNILTYVGGLTGGVSAGASIGKFFGPEGILAGAIVGGAGGLAIGGITVLVRKAMQTK